MTSAPSVAIRRVPAVAGADAPHGAYCRLTRGKAYPQAEADGSGGISAGPSTVRGFTPKGEPLQIQTDGGVMTEAGFVVFRDGRPIE